MRPWVKHKCDATCHGTMSSLGTIEPVKMKLQLVDRSITHPVGILKDVIIKTGKTLFPVDFIVLDMEKDGNMPLILGRSFLSTGSALIDAKTNQIKLRVGREEVNFKMTKLQKYPSKRSCSYFDVINGLIGDEFELKTIINDSKKVMMDTGVKQEENCSAVFFADPNTGDLEEFDGTNFNAEEEWAEEEEADPVLMQDPTGKSDSHLSNSRKLLPSVESPPELELKILPDHLKYIFLAEHKKLPVIVSAKLTTKQEIALVEVLKSHVHAIG